MKDDEIYKVLVREKKAHEEEKQKEYEQKSRDRLKAIVKKKMETVMIGALSAIEEKLGFIWGHDSDEDLTENQVYAAALYQELRSKILDLGNTQIRNAQTEIDMYTVEWNRYNYKFEVKRREEG